MSKIGYISVSTEHQETVRQQEIMCDYQVDRIFSENLSEANGFPHSADLAKRKINRL